MSQLIELNIEQAARQIGCSREGLRRGLIALGQNTARGRRYDLRLIFRAIAPDGKVARARRDEAQAEQAELEAGQMRGDLVPMAEVQSLIRDCYLPIRQRLIALPGELAHRCNPSDPALARAALQVWVDESLPLIRQQMKGAS